jgi:hypothetical protein
MFATKRKDVQIDGGEDLGLVTVTLRKLSGSSLEKAAMQRGIAQAAYFRSLGAPFMVDMQSPALQAAREILAEEKANEKKDPAALRRARYSNYDRESVLIAGIERWTCEDKFKLSPKSIALLEDAEAQKLHEEILDFSLPPIDEDEAAEVPKD